MSRFSYSLDVGEELEREKEVRRRIAAARGEEEERTRIDPKFEQELNALADEPQPRVEDDDSIIITPAKVGKESIRIESPRESPERQKATQKKAEAPKKAERQEEAPKPKPRTAPKAKAAVRKQAKERQKEEFEEVPLKVVEPSGPAPAPPAPSYTEPRTPSDGSGRLVVALLLIALVGIFLIYTGLASDDQRQSCALRFAGAANVTPVSLDALSGARQYWFRRAMLVDNEGEAAAMLRMALCGSGNLTEESNPLGFQSCDAGGLVVEVGERDVRALLNMSARVPCDALEGVISCDNGYFVDGMVAFKDQGRPASLVARFGGRYTVVKMEPEAAESLVVVSDKAGDYVSYTLPPAGTGTMALKLFVGDAFAGFERVYLDHYNGGDRVVLYALV